MLWLCKPQIMVAISISDDVNDHKFKKQLLCDSHHLAYAIPGENQSGQYTGSHPAAFAV